MQLTKIKRRELNRGDMFVLDNTRDISQIYLAVHDGGTSSINIANETIYRIDIPDYTYELPQFTTNQKRMLERLRDRLQ